MSFKLKFAITFCSILFFTALVASTSWWGMNDVLQRQEALYTFNSNLEKKLQLMLHHDHAFATDDELAHSQTVHALLADTQGRINSVFDEIRDKKQKKIVSNLLDALSQYKQSFTDYTKHNIDMQTMRSRMFHESRRLLANADSLEPIGINPVEIYRLMNSVFQAEKDYMLWGRGLAAEKINKTSQLIVQYVNSVREETREKSIKLKTFHITNAAEVYQTAFNQFVTAQNRRQNSFAEMRNSLGQVENEIRRYMKGESEIAQKAVVKLKITTGAVFLLVLISGLFATILLSRLITRPIDQLKKLANRIETGDLDTQVKINSRDEIGELGIIFNRMASRLKKSFDDLESYRDNLENLVEERTADLRESKTLFDSFMSNLPALVFMKDLEGRYLYLNDAYMKFFNERPPERVGKTDDEIYPADTANRLRENDKKVMSEGKTLNIVEVIPINNNDSFHRVSKFPIFKNGHPHILAGISFNITEQLQAEEDKQRLEAQLQRSQKMEALGLLAGGVAHDLNNVLSGIVSYPELLLMDIPENSPLRKPLLTIQQSGEKAAEIVQDLLTLARRGVMHTEVLNLNHIIDEYLNSPEHEKLISYHQNVQTGSNLANDLLNIRCSSIHIKKTIMNLMYNAAEAQPRGGEIAVSTANRYVDKPIKGYEDVKEGDYVVLKVEDRGKGIAHDDLKRLFEPFYTKKVMGRSGTGLGMAVVWGTVQDHKGYIDLKSTVGVGTVFELYFPATREYLDGEESLIPVEEYMGNGELILIVDDTAEQREIASGILKKLKYSVTTASSGEDAIDYLTNKSVDLVVLDMIMDPGIDGLEAYKKIIAIHPGQKAVIASGFSESERVKEIQRLGAKQYIRKPYTIKKIGFAVKKELQTS